MPPTPSRTYCARRTSGSPAYRREVVQRALSAFSGRSASRRNSGTRPTSTRHTCATRSTPSTCTRDRERGAVVARDERCRQTVGVGVDPVLVLHARRVDPLAEVALAVQQADGGERGGLVGGLLEDVAREGAEAAGVDRQRRVDAVLGAEEDGAATADVGPRGHLGGDPALDLLGPRDEAVVGRRAQQRARRRLLEQVDGVVARALPAVGVDVVEELGPARPPGPAVVVREAGEHPQALGHP